LNAPTSSHKNSVDMEPEALRDAALHAARLYHGGNMAQFKGVGFRSPRFLHLDHRAVVANIWVARKGRLKNYRHAHQKFPLTLPLGPKDANTTTFDALAAKCIEPKKKRLPGKDWISEGTWRLIAKRASLLHSGKIRQAAARRIKREVQAALKAD
jgi:hypothetical protein